MWLFKALESLSWSHLPLVQFSVSLTCLCLSFCLMRKDLYDGVRFVFLSLLLKWLKNANKILSHVLSVILSCLSVMLTAITGQLPLYLLNRTKAGVQMFTACVSFDNDIPSLHVCGILVYIGHQAQLFWTTGFFLDSTLVSKFELLQCKTCWTLLH